jgi:hypothetical protein
MRPVATLGNECNVVAIGTYYNNLPFIAMNIVIAIDLNPCSVCSRCSHITIIESHKRLKLNQILDAYYIEIIANSSYALRNKENYSQVSNMIMTSSIYGTTQSKSITSPQNNDKLSSTNMHTALEQYPGFDLPQTMRGMMLNSKWRW